MYGERERKCNDGEQKCLQPRAERIWTCHWEFPFAGLSRLTHSLSKACNSTMWIELQFQVLSKTSFANAARQVSAAGTIRFAYCYPTMDDSRLRNAATNRRFSARSQIEFAST